MKHVTLEQDMHMPCRVQCNCAHSDRNGWSFSPIAGIEYQEGRLYIMCRHCGRVNMWKEGAMSE